MQTSLYQLFFLGVALISRISAFAYLPSPTTSHPTVKTTRNINPSSSVSSRLSTTMANNNHQTIFLAKEDAPSKSSETSSLLSTVYEKIGSTTSIVVAGTFFVVLAYQRDALMVSFFIGAISNGILSKVLKKVLNQERPAELDETQLDLPPSDNGMPSSHAMSLGFICTFTALQLPWTALPLLLYVITSLVYRVQTNLHSTEQILVGITIGTLNGYIWKSLCFGSNIWNINVMEWVTANLLNAQGVLPVYAMAVPALVGAAVVGSIERRISRFFKNRSKEE